MTKEKEIIINQTKFCEELMNRLITEIAQVTDEANKYHQNKSRTSNDVKRLRRELNTLRKQIDNLW